MPRFEFEEGVKMTVDRAPGTRNDICKVCATSAVAAMKGLCWLVEKTAGYMGLTVEQVICRIAATMLGPAGQNAQE